MMTATIATRSQAVAIRPQSRQELFLRLSCDVALFGGSAFGGKSYSLLLEPLYHIHRPGFGAVAFRRTYPEIMGEGGLWEESAKIYQPAPLSAQSTKTRLLWTFPSGARVRFAHLQREDDKYHYAGWQIALLLFDQLEQFSESQFFYLLSRTRTYCGIRAYCRASCNPDPDSWLANFLSWWIGDDGFPIEERSGIVRWFARAGDELVWGDSRQELIDRGHESAKSFTFIPSRPEDNPIGLANNPGYLATLEALPYVERMRLRYGNWLVRPAAGKLINREWLKIVPMFNWEGGRAVLFWDFAATEKTTVKRDPDYTASVLMIQAKAEAGGAGIVIPGRWCIADCYAAQLAPTDVDKQFVAVSRQAARWCAERKLRFSVRWEQEPGAAAKRENIRYARMLAGLDARGVPARKDKIERARGFMAQCEMRNVDVLQGPWNDRWLNHMHNQPEAAHDDIWDASSGSFNELAGGGVFFA